MTFRHKKTAWNQTLMNILPKNLKNIRNLYIHVRDIVIDQIGQVHVCVLYGVDSINKKRFLGN